MLVVCPECKNEVSQYAELCPNCGFPITKFMKDNKLMDTSKMEVCPKCPTCGSTKIRKISGTKRAASILGFGILSNNIGKNIRMLKL